MMKVTAEGKEWFLFAIVLAIGGLLMLTAGHFALQLPSTWEISDISMDSKLNPNEVYALYREDYDFRLAPIRTDIPNLIATSGVMGANQTPIVPPPAFEFNAPVVIVTTTPFIFNTLPPPGPAGTSAAATASAANTLPVASSPMPGTPTASVPTVPTYTASPIPSPTPWPTWTPWPTATRTATRTLVPPPTNTNVPPATPWPTPTPTWTQTHTPVHSATATATATSTMTATVTATATVTSTATVTATASATATASPTATDTPTPTATATDTPTATPTNTETPTPTATFTATPLPICTITGSAFYTIPVGGCTARYNTAAQGGIFYLSMWGSGSLSVDWYGLGSNQTIGTCSARSATFAQGSPLYDIAVAKSSGTTTFTINNPTGASVTVLILVSGWTTGGCQ